MPENDQLAHDEQMYQEHGDGLTKDQHLTVYALAYEHGHSAGYSEVEGYYRQFAEFARNLLDAD